MGLFSEFVCGFGRGTGWVGECEEGGYCEYCEEPVLVDV